MRWWAMIAAALVLGGCETWYVPLPDLDGDGKGSVLAVPTTRTAQCRLRDKDRLGCISDCEKAYADREDRGVCVQRCDALNRSCAATPSRRDPILAEGRPMGSGR